MKNEKVHLFLSPHDCVDVGAVEGHSFRERKEVRKRGRDELNK